MKNKPVIEEVVHHSELLARTSAGWVNRESYVVSGGPIMGEGATFCNQCGREMAPHVGSCNLNGCYGVGMLSEKAVGLSQQLLFRIELDQDAVLHQRHLEIERLRAELKTAKEAEKEAEGRATTAEGRVADLERQYELSKNTNGDLLTAAQEKYAEERRMKTHLAALRVSIGSQRFDEIVSAEPGSLAGGL